MSEVYKDAMELELTVNCAKCGEPEGVYGSADWAENEVDDFESELKDQGWGPSPDGDELWCDGCLAKVGEEEGGEVSNV